MLIGEKLVVVWTKYQSSHNLPLSQSLIRSKASTLFDSRKAERGEEAAEEKSAASRGRSMRFKEGSGVHNLRVQGGKQQVLTWSCSKGPRDLAGRAALHSLRGRADSPVRG